MAIPEPEKLSLGKPRELASAAPPCISSVLLEHEARDARIAFKNAIGKSIRIGLTRNVDRKLRFYERGNPYVSGPKRLRE